MKRKERTLIGLPPSVNAIPPLRWSENGKYLAYLSTNNGSSLHIYDEHAKKVKTSISPIDVWSDFQWLEILPFSLLENPKKPILTQTNIITNTTKNYRMLDVGEIKKIAITKNKVLFVGREGDQNIFNVMSLTLRTVLFKR